MILDTFQQFYAVKYHVFPFFSEESMSLIITERVAETPMRVIYIRGKDFDKRRLDYFVNKLKNKPNTKGVIYGEDVVINENINENVLKYFELFIRFVVNENSAKPGTKATKCKYLDIINEYQEKLRGEPMRRNTGPTGTPVKKRQRINGTRGCPSHNNFSFSNSAF